ncbi:MAG: hypothetical protein KME16_00730 [Scytolyngbya sp. HA4215-MV1]|nr:hypothetical protein [Scytolyngbya sp. HA4215-MV1]
MRAYSYAGLLPKVKQQICDMAINGSGIRDICMGDTGFEPVTPSV